MSEPEDKKMPPWAVKVAEETVTAASGLAGVALTGNPLVGTAVGIGVKGIIAAVRSAATSRTQRRAEGYEAEIAKLLQSGDEQGLIHLINDDERFAEIVFQNYRRAMDALDPLVIPALAKLTLQYKDRTPDGFFRSLGEVLEELVGDELETLRQICSAIASASTLWGGVPSIEVTPWKASSGRQEIHFASPDNRRRVLAFNATRSALRVLEVVERHGLAMGFDDRGANLAMANRLELAVEPCRQVSEIIGHKNPELFEPVFEH